MAFEKQRKTFLSYSRTNTDFAKKLAKELKAEGFPVWLDQLDIPLGARWDVELEKALEECEIFMIIMTPDSIDSENVRDEIGYAIDTGKRFMPIMLEKCNIPLRLRRFQYVDFTTKSFDDGVEAAKKLLRGLIAQDTIPQRKLLDGTQAQVAQAEADRKAKAEAKRLAKQKTEQEQAERENETSSFAAEREKLLKASTLMKQGSQLLQDGDFSEAVKVFREILTIMPNHEKTLALLAEAEAGTPQEKASSDRKFKEESDSFKASRENVIKASDLLAQGKKLLENKSWAEAAKIFKQVLTLTPNHSETKSLLADVEAQILQEREGMARKTKADDEQLAKAKADTERKAKEEADRLAKNKATEELAAKTKSESERKAKEEADRLAAQKAEEEQLAKQMAEDERIAKVKAEREAKAEADRKAKVEADRLAAQKTEMERVAKQQAEVDRLAREKPTPVGQVNEKATGKKSITKGIVIGGVVGVVLCIVAVFAIVSWANNTVTPTDTPLKVTATNRPNATATKLNTATAVPIITGPIVLNSSEARILYEAGEYTSLYSIAGEQYTEEQINDFRNNNEWIPVELTSSTPILLGYGWCAVNSDILQDNLEYINLYFVFNDKDVPENKYVDEYWTAEDGWECFHRNVVIDQWVTGDYPIYYGLVINQNLNDGEYDYFEGDGGQIAIYVTVP